MNEIFEAIFFVLCLFILVAALLIPAIQAWTDIKNANSSKYDNSLKNWFIFPPGGTNRLMRNPYNAFYEIFMWWKLRNTQAKNK